MQTDGNLPSRSVRAQINHRYRAFIGNVTDGIDAYTRPPRRRAGHTLRVRATTTPVAHIRLFPHEHHIVGRDTYVSEANHLAGIEIEFRETVGQIQRNV